MIAVTETWCDNSVTDAEVELPGYLLTRNGRNRDGCGVCLYTRTDLAFNPLTDLEQDGLEAMGGHSTSED